MTGIHSTLRSVPPKAVKADYDCSQCPGYCCTYEVIPVTKRDLRRLARRFDITVEQAERRFTKKEGKGRAMRHRKDHIFDSTCMFFDQENRRCSIYEDRPQICRTFPSDGHCGYFEFMKWEQSQQDDDDFVPIVVSR